MADEAPSGSSTWRVWRRALCMSGLVACALAPLPARADGPLETAVKAAYLYKFMGYVEWPATEPRTPDAPLTIGVAGSDALLAELQGVIAGRQVNGRALTARKVGANEAVEGLQALYMGRSAVASGMLSLTRGRAILVVTDEPDGLPDGAVLNFVLIDGRVRFEASVKNADRAGLRLSARLLSVAERVVAP